MLDREERLQLRKLLADAVPLLCKSSISGYVESQFCVEAMIGITVDEQQVAIICFKETLDTEGRTTSGQYGEEERESYKKESQACENAEVGHEEHYEDDDCQVLSENETAGFGSSSVRVKNEPDVSGYETARPRKRARVAEYGESSQGQAYGSWDMAPSSSSGAGVEHDRFIKQEQYSEQDIGTEGVYTKEEQQDESEALYGEDWEGYYEDESAEQTYDEEMGSELTPQTSYSTDAQFQRKRGGGRASASGRRPGGAQARARYQNVGRSPGGRGGQGGRQAAAAPSSRFHLNQADFSAGGGDTGVGGGGVVGGATGRRDILEGLCRTIASQSQIEQQFVCHICNARLANRQSLVIHIKGSHLAEGLYRCELCDNASFKWYMQLHRHRKKFHPDAVAADSADMGEESGESY